MLSQPKISNLGAGQRIKPAGRSKPNLISELNSTRETKTLVLACIIGSGM